MFLPSYNNAWPESWRKSYGYDLLELVPGNDNLGYRYSYARRQKETVALVRKYAPPGARILDVAAAQGNFSIALAELGYQVTWNDLRSDLIEYVRQKAGQIPLAFTPGNIFSLSSKEKYDVVLLNEVIEHVAHPDALLCHAVSLMSPGGCIVVTTPNGGYCRFNNPRFSECKNPAEYEAHQFLPDADGHIFLLHEDEIPELAKGAGLEVREMRVFNCPLTNGHIKLRWLLAYLPEPFVDITERVVQRMPNPIKEYLSSNMAMVFTRERS